jgi:hypothetical protein
MRGRGTLLAALVRGFGCAAGLAVVAGLAAAPAAGGLEPPPRAARFGDQPQLAKLSGRLLEARRLLRRGAAVGELPAALRGLPMRGGEVAIEVRLERLDATVESLLVGAGLGDSRFYPARGTATGRIDPQRLDELAAILEVALVKELRPPRRRAGTVTSQGDGSIRADLARLAEGVDGTGVRVGILSDSLNALLGGTPSGAGCSRTLSGTAPQIADELPSSVVLPDDCDMGDTTNCTDLVDEGRALAEIVHDLAPGADILFHTGFKSEADMASGIAELRGPGCAADVIIDDLIYEDEPMFQDGLIALAAQAAVDDGAVYLSAAGNDADFGIDDVYLDINPALAHGDGDPGEFGADFHDFGGGDGFASIRVAAGCGLTAVLQWNEPFDAPLGPGASTDLDLLRCPDPSDPDLCVYADLGPLGQGCGNSNDPNSNPSEVLTYLNDSGSAETVYLAVDNFCDDLAGSVSPLRFRLVVFADGVGCSLGNAVRDTTANCASSGASYCFESGVFEDPQIYGHPVAAGALAVAASSYMEIDSGGAADPPPSQIDVQPFSSLGGDLPFYYDGGGSPLPGAPVTRFKPDLTGPDSVNTSFFGHADPNPSGVFEGDGFPNFVGSSAAVPHAAAVAALLREAEPGLTGTDVGKLLRCSARDIETAGKDDLSGHGLVDAVDALAALSPDVAVHKSASLTTNTGDGNRLDAGDVLTYSYHVTNTSAVTLESVDVTDNHMGAGALGAISCADATLAPQATTTCSATYTVQAADVTAGAIANEATATGLACGVAAAQAGATDSLTLPLCELDRVLGGGGSGPGTVVEEACRSIDTGGPYEIPAGADVTFRAGQTIILRDDFSVAAGALFVAAIDPDLDLD